MKRGLWAVVALVMSWTTSTAVVAEEYMEGVEYTRISKPLRTVEKPGTVEVREYFWYGCPHCFRLEPLMHRWLAGNPENVRISLDEVSSIPLHLKQL